VTGDEAHSKRVEVRYWPMSSAASGVQEPATPTPWTCPHARPAIALDTGAHRTHRSGGGQHVVTFQQPLDPALADRSADSISARWLIDLSPGTSRDPTGRSRGDF